MIRGLFLLLVAGCTWWPDTYEFLPPEGYLFLPSGGSFDLPEAPGLSMSCPTLEIESRRFAFTIHAWAPSTRVGPRLVAVEADGGIGPVSLPFESRNRGDAGVSYAVNWDAGPSARRIADEGLTLRFRLEGPSRTVELKMSPRRQVR